MCGSFLIIIKIRMRLLNAIEGYLHSLRKLKVHSFSTLLVASRGMLLPLSSDSIAHNASVIS